MLALDLYSNPHPSHLSFEGKALRSLDRPWPAPKSGVALSARFHHFSRTAGRNTARSESTLPSVGAALLEHPYKIPNARNQP